MQPDPTVGLNRKSREPEKTTLLDTAIAEFWKERARQAARKDFQGSWFLIPESYQIENDSLWVLKRKVATLKGQIDCRPASDH
jgi:hypothetical protein